MTAAVPSYSGLGAESVSPDLILFADEGHGASKRANQVLSIGHVIRFFEQNLKRRTSNG